MRQPLHWQWVPAAGLFCGVLAILLLTLAPTIYTLDSAEFATGAQSLGFVHAPGYPLYLTLAHLFTALPLGDVAYRVNLFSALCLAGAAVALYGTFAALVEEAWAALAATLMVVWSQYVWANGLVAEVYSLHLLTLAVTGWILARLAAFTSPPGPFSKMERGSQAQQDRGMVKLALWGGVSYGLALAITPTTALFAPGLALAYRLLRVPWKLCLAAGLLSVGVFLLSLLYFPLRYAAALEFNVIGRYDLTGQFTPADLQSVTGVWDVLRGREFEHLFFAEGYLPSTGQLGEFARQFGGNFLGLGILMGLIGLYHLRQRRGALAVWLALSLPYTYFFMTYGAEDHLLMLGPSYALWGMVSAVGLAWAMQGLDGRLKALAALGLVCPFLIVNYPRLDLSDDTRVYDENRALLEMLPPDSVVFGRWLDVAPLQYLQVVEHRRRDVALYNLRLFETTPHLPYFAEGGRPVFLLDDETDLVAYAQAFDYAVSARDVPGTRRQVYAVRPSP